MIIYQITNIVNGKFYIGQTRKKNPQERFREHLKSGERLSTTVLAKAIRKYGQDKFAFEIIENNIADLKLLTERENYWIAKLNPHYNMRRKTDYSCAQSYEEIYGIETALRLKKLRTQSNIKRGSRSTETRQRISSTRTKKIKEGVLPKQIPPQTPQSIRKRVESYKKLPKLVCPHCKISSNNRGNMNRWHMDNCKYLIFESSLL